MKLQLKRGSAEVVGLRREVEEHVNSHVFLKDQLELMPLHLIEALTENQELATWYVTCVWLAYRGNVALVDPDFLCSRLRALYFLLNVESMRRKGYVMLRNWPLSLFESLDKLDIASTELGEARLEELRAADRSRD